MLQTAIENFGLFLLGATYVAALAGLNEIALRLLMGRR